MSMPLAQITAFLHREARLLEDREWDEWLAC
jgi:benzoate/toluate 1,2-dioxygenase beta subunit